tara:strand:- start:1370 stop:1819 length:450 start_codon:yes stop_codon:yes gene_type:complete
MNKILSFIFVFFLFSCSYDPILKQKNYNFSINLNNVKGDKEINSIISEKFNSINGSGKNYELTLISNKTKKIMSKDTKGDPSIFELQINVKYKVNISNKNLIEREVNRKTTYNNISDKFELENYEKSIVKNLSLDISDNIINSISDIHE